MESDVSRHGVLVRGRVQGVFFRDSARQVASSLGLSGWVRNLADGSVEAVFEGERSAVERAVEWCGRGPAGARVDEVIDQEESLKGTEGFEIKY